MHGEHKKGNNYNYLYEFINMLMTDMIVPAFSHSIFFHMREFLYNYFYFLQSSEFSLYVILHVTYLIVLALSKFLYTRHELIVTYFIYSDAAK